MDSLDPFSAFTTEVKSALPDAGKSDGVGAADGAAADATTIFDLAPKEAPARKEVMRAPSITAAAAAPAMQGYPAAAPPQAMNSYGAPPQAVNPWGQPAQQPQAPPAAVPPPAAAPAGAMVPSAAPSADPYGLAAFGAPAAAAPAPIVPAPAAPVAYSPFDQPAAAPPAAPPAPVAAPPAPVPEPVAPYSAPAPTTESIASAYNSDPFGVFGGAAPAPVQPDPVAPPAPAAAPVAADPWGPSPTAPAPPESAPAPPAPPVPAPAAQGDDDFFGDFFANAAPPAAAPAPVAAPAVEATPAVSSRGQPMPAATVAPVAAAISVEGMPPGGKQYTAEIPENSLGVVFFEATSLKKTIYHEGESDVDDLGERPVVAFMTMNSAARKANVKVGHVLLNVNGVNVKNPKEANKAIKATKERPFRLTFWIPDFPIMFFEGMHMVKYDERTGLAPVRPTDWKPKYVVIGGVIGYHWQMKMYRNHKEYDTAVMETFNHVPVSVKVKDFGIHHTCRLNIPEVRKITYKVYDGSETWYYIAMKSPLNNCIKISSKNMDALNNMMNGIKAVLRTYHQIGADYELNKAERY